MRLTWSPAACTPNLPARCASACGPCHWAAKANWDWTASRRRWAAPAPLYDARSDNPGRPSELSGAALAELQKDLEAGRWRSVPQLQRWLAQTHGVKLALSSLYDRLGKACARLRVPRQSHVKKDPAAAREFRTELAVKLTALALPPGPPARRWVLDEMRYGLHGFTRRVWGLPGHRPVVPTQQKYQWGFVYGAVGVGLSRTEFLLTETMDQAHRVEFYRQIRRGDPAVRSRRSTASRADGWPGGGAIPRWPSRAPRRM